MEIKCNDNFISFNQEKLKLVKEIIQQMKNILKNIIEDINNTLNIIPQFENKINSFEVWTKNIAKYKPEENDKFQIENNNDILIAFEGYNKISSKIINDLLEYQKLHKDVSNHINNLLFFKDLPKVESKIDIPNNNIHLNISKKSLTASDMDRTETQRRKLQIFDSYNDNSNNLINIINEDNKEEKNNFICNCFVCNKEEATKIFQNELFCNNCLFKYVSKNDILYEYLNESPSLNKMSKNEINETLFLNSISIIIKRLLIKSNYLIKKGIIDSKEIILDVEKIFVYPFINSTPDFDSCLNFVKNANSVFKDFF